jgi:hypothetical protein
MPAALYPRKRTITATTQAATMTNPNQVKDYLLCRDCEGKFNGNGESEVLRWLAPKASRKHPFPLLDKIRGVVPIRTEADLSIYSGAALGLEMGKFAYFALSVVWRGAVTLPDGTLTSPLDLGPHEEPVRRFLLNEAPFPQEAAVTVAVCTDTFTREYWIAPMVSTDYGCSSFRILTLGAVFGVWIGSRIPHRIRRYCCRSSPEQAIFGTHCDDQTARVLGGLAPL